MRLLGGCFFSTWMEASKGDSLPTRRRDLRGFQAQDNVQNT